MIWVAVAVLVLTAIFGGIWTAVGLGILGFIILTVIGMGSD